MPGTDLLDARYGVLLTYGMPSNDLAYAPTPCRGVVQQLCTRAHRLRGCIRSAWLPRYNMPSTVIASYATDRASYGTDVAIHGTHIASYGTGIAFYAMPGAGIGCSVYW
eukprot:1191073-Rhodomonas_salina.4